MELVILKLGGSVITKKRAETLEVDSENLARLACEICEARKEREFSLVVVHGAGPFGHLPASKYSLTEGLRSEEQLFGFSLTHSHMEKLNFEVVSALRDAGLYAIAYQPSAVGILKGRDLSYFPVKVLEKLIDMGMTPVAYGDVLVEEDMGLNILSGDHLVPYLARKLKADRIVLVTDVDGVYDKDPSDPDAKLVEEITRDDVSRLEVGGCRSTDVTGGMRRKLCELLDAGIESRIISGLRPGLLKKSLLGEACIGTLIRP